MQKTSKKRYLRFSKQDRQQHWLLVFSFSLLALTGIVQKFSSSDISQSIIALLGGIESVRIIHRFAAVVLMIVAVYHIAAVSYRFLVLRQRASILPLKNDFIDAWNMLRFNLGLGKNKPRYDRYSFEEKFEYWAVVWGLGVMIVTGFMLLNPIATTKFLPGEAIPAAKSAHGNEALLAVIAIVLWHFYNVLVRHFNKSMFTGYLTKEEMEEYHPLELAEIESGGVQEQPDTEVEKRRKIYVPLIAVFGVVFLAAIFGFVTFEDSALETIVPVEGVASPYPDPAHDPLPSQADQDESRPLGDGGAAALDLMWPSSAHSDEAAAAFRYWDPEGQVDAECSVCHSSAGLPYFRQHGSAVAQPVSDGLFCTTCHSDTSDYTLYSIDQLTFPSGVSVEGEAGEISVCVVCHQGTTAGSAVDLMVAGIDQDQIDANLNFVDVHSPSPGATLFGAQAMAAYQYEDNTYKGLNRHVADFNSCQDCHQPHELTVNSEACSTCHAELSPNESLRGIRFSVGDFDGDGDESEGIAEEIEGLRGLLWGAMRNYSSEAAGVDIAYDAASAHHYFADVNGNGVVDPDELGDDNLYSSWTPRLLKAAFNYHYSGMDAGGFAHNPIYLIQILYDSLEDLGVDVSLLSRP